MSELNINAAFPLQTLVEKILDYHIRYRESMDPDIRRRWDVLFLAWAERVAETLTPKG